MITWPHDSDTFSVDDTLAGHECLQGHTPCNNGCIRSWCLKCNKVMTFDFNSQAYIIDEAYEKLLRGG